MQNIKKMEAEKQSIEYFIYISNTFITVLHKIQTMPDDNFVLKKETQASLTGLTFRRTVWRTSSDDFLTSFSVMFMSTS